jgi:hypothetical protein
MRHSVTSHYRETYGKEPRSSEKSLSNRNAKLRECNSIR